jgi:hypothetical protein
MTKVTDLYPFYQKLNYNCPDSEKTGEGSGSCGGDKSDDYKMRRIIGEKLQKGQQLTKEERDFVKKLKADIAKQTGSSRPVSQSQHVVPSKKIAFVPAASVEEAQKFAYDNLIDPKERERVERWNSGETAHTTPDRVQQIEIVKYRGLDTKVVNIVNEQIAKNISLGLSYPRRIIAVQLRNTPHVMARMGTNGDLEFNTIAMGNFKKLTKELDAAKELKGKTGTSALETLQNNYDKMDAAQKRQFEHIKEYVKYERGGVGAEIGSTPERMIQANINHEFAHDLLRHGRLGYDSPQHKEFTDDVEEMAEMTKESDYKYKLSSYGCLPNKTGLGGFSAGQNEETFAELYAAYRFYEDDKIRPEVLSMMKKWLPER